MQVPESTCRCYLEEDEWGRSGFHFRYMNRGDLPRSMTHHPGGDDVGEARLAEYADVYRGKWIAFGRCPAYWGAKREEELL